MLFRSAKFLREVGVKIVQLTFFGGEETTDRYIGRKGAYSELLKATEILLRNGIAPRWQAFINALAKIESKTLDNVILVAEQKNEKRGAFNEKIFLEKVIESNK